MRKNEKKVLAESNVQNIVRISLGNGKKSKENSDLKQKFQDLLKENESLRRENAAFKRKSQAEADFQEKFHRLLLENNALEQELKNFKAELAELQRNTEKSQQEGKTLREFGEIQRKLEKSFAFLEENVVFFRNEAVKAREKLSGKEKELENLYINYMKESENLVKLSQKNEILLAEIESLRKQR